jgi:hypothetical protein
MKLSFLPGELYLTTMDDGVYLVTIAEQEVLRTPSQKAAKAKFDALRKEMETRFPTREMTAEEKAELWRFNKVDEMIGHNSLGGRKKKTSAGGTRTFGG